MSMINVRHYQPLVPPAGSRQTVVRQGANGIDVVDVVEPGSENYMARSDKDYGLDAQGNVVAQTDPACEVVLLGKGMEIPPAMQERYGLPRPVPDYELPQPWSQPPLPPDVQGIVDKAMATVAHETAVATIETPRPRAGNRSARQ